MKITRSVSSKSKSSDENLTQLIIDDENAANYNLHNAHFQEMKVRIELCDALDSLNTSLRSLMGLIGRHNFITTIPEAAIPKYETMVHTIGTAVSNATKIIEKSRSLDKKAALNINNFTGRPQ